MAFLDSMGDDWNGEAVEADPKVETPEVPAEAETVTEEAPETGAETETEEATQEAPTEQAEEKFNPTLYKEMKEERRKRQEAERELERLRTQAPQQPHARDVIPDAYERPEEFNAYLDQRDFNVRAETSGIRAEIKYGEETVKAATEWALSQNDPALGFRVRQAASPVELVVQEYQRSRTLETIGTQTPEEFAKTYAVQQGWIVSPEAPQPPAQQQSSSAPPRGLSRVPGSGSKATPSGADWGEVKFPLG